MRPGRPMAGWLASRCTARSMASTTRCAAARLSREICSASASRFASARFSHRTFSGLPGTPRPLTAAPLVHCVPHLLVACELSSIRLCHSLSDLLDLPLVYGDVLTDGFSSNERAAAALRLGQTVKAFPHLRLQPQRHYPVFRHEYPPNTKEHCVF